jgi:hypothetical protein
LCSQNCKVFEIDILHVCGINPYLHPDFFPYFLKQLNMIFKFFKVVRALVPRSQKSLLFFQTIILELILVLSKNNFLSFEKKSNLKKSDAKIFNFFKLKFLQSSNIEIVQI